MKYSCTRSSERMNEIYKKLIAIKLNKLRLEKVFQKIIFSFSKVNFSLLEKNPKKINFFFIFVHMIFQNFRHMKYYILQQNCYEI